MADVAAARGIRFFSFVEVALNPVRSYSKHLLHGSCLFFTCISAIMLTSPVTDILAWDPVLSVITQALCIYAVVAGSNASLKVRRSTRQGFTAYVSAGSRYPPSPSPNLSRRSRKRRSRLLHRSPAGVGFSTRPTRRNSLSSSLRARLQSSYGSFFPVSRAKSSTTGSGSYYPSCSSSPSPTL